MAYYLHGGKDAVESGWRRRRDREEEERGRAVGREERRRGEDGREQRKREDEKWRDHRYSSHQQRDRAPAYRSFSDDTRHRFTRNSDEASIRYAPRSKVSPTSGEGMIPRPPVLTIHWGKNCVSFSHGQLSRLRSNTVSNNVPLDKVHWAIAHAMRVERRGEGEEFTRQIHGRVAEGRTAEEGEHHHRLGGYSLKRGPGDSLQKLTGPATRLDPKAYRVLAFRVAVAVMDKDEDKDEDSGSLTPDSDEEREAKKAKSDPGTIVDVERKDSPVDLSSYSLGHASGKDAGVTYEFVLILYDMKSAVIILEDLSCLLVRKEHLLSY